MANGIVKLDTDKFVEWSSICDAPKTYVFSLNAGIKMFGKERMDRADTKGTSYHDRESAESFFEFNRAGPNEECLTREEMIEQYTKKESDQ